MGFTYYIPVFKKCGVPDGTIIFCTDFVEKLSGFATWLDKRKKEEGLYTASLGGGG